MKRYTPAQRQKDLQIIKYVEEYWINLDNPYESIEDKINLLEKICGWKNLRVNPNNSLHPFVPIRKCSDGRISMVVKTLYNQAKIRLEKYKEPTKGQLEISEKQ